MKFSPGKGELPWSSSSRHGIPTACIAWTHQQPFGISYVHAQYRALVLRTSLGTILIERDHHNAAFI